MGGLQQRDGNLSVFSVWVLGGRVLAGQGSQMKQIKGELWPPGETLVEHRDGIQMEDHVRVL